MDVVTLVLAKNFTKKTKEEIEQELETKADLVDGKIPSSQLPSYVDDAVEYPDLASFPEVGEEGKIYIALDTGYTYRWSGTTYVQIGGQDLSNYQTLITPDNKLASDLVDDTNQTNKFTTTEEKEKLAGIAAGAQVNVLEGVQINGTDLTITNKKVNIPVDSTISSVSENPVQNKVIKAALDEKVDIDDTTDFEVSENQISGAPLLGSISIDDDPYNIPKKTSDLINDSGFINEVESELEVIAHQTDTPLTEEQVKKAVMGKLVIYVASHDAYLTATINDAAGHITFNGSNISSGSSPLIAAFNTFNNIKCILDVDTRYLSGLTITDEGTAISANNNNVIDANTIPDASGRQLIRALNLYKTQSMIAPVYDATATYAIGDYVLYQNILYQCILEISTPEAWTSGHWQQIDVVSKLKALDNVITILVTETALTWHTFTQSEINALMSKDKLPVILHQQNNVGPVDIYFVSGTTSTLIDIKSINDLFTQNNILRESKISINKANGQCTPVSSSFGNFAIANESLAGNEEELTELTVGPTKYKLSQYVAMTSQEIADAVVIASADPILENNSWETIRKVCEAGKAAEVGWQVGDTKTDTGTDSVTRTMRICDMQGLYGKHVVFEQVEQEATAAVLNQSSNLDDDNCYNNYNISDMRNTVLPALLNNYSSDLSSQITNTTYKVAKNGNSATILELTDKLFLPAEKEIFGSATYSRTEEASALTWFALYQANNTNAFRIKYRSGEAQSWWERSPGSGYTGRVCYVNSGGNADNGIVNVTRGVAPCFAF